MNFGGGGGGGGGGQTVDPAMIMEQARFDALRLSLCVFASGGLRCARVVQVKAEMSQQYLQARPSRAQRSAAHGVSLCAAACADSRPAARSPRCAQEFITVRLVARSRLSRVSRAAPTL